MEILDSKKDNVTILELVGRLDTTNYNVLEKKIIDLIDNNVVNILVDCSKLDYVSSSGLRILLMALKKIASAKGKFVLCSLQENIAEIFEISGFTSIFEIFPGRSEALGSFSS
jgi:anti-sigma B factor antagonist